MRTERVNSHLPGRSKVFTSCSSAVQTFPVWYLTSLTLVTPSATKKRDRQHCMPNDYFTFLLRTHFVSTQLDKNIFKNPYYISISGILQFSYYIQLFIALVIGDIFKQNASRQSNKSSHFLYHDSFLHVFPVFSLGLCLRLYPQSLYEEGMGEAHCPGVVEENLSHLVLLLKRLDIADMGQCKFLDRPGTFMNYFK